MTTETAKFVLFSPDFCQQDLKLYSVKVLFFFDYMLMIRSHKRALTHEQVTLITLNELFAISLCSWTAYSSKPHGKSKERFRLSIRKCSCMRLTDFCKASVLLRCSHRGFHLQFFIFSILLSELSDPYIYISRTCLFLLRMTGC